jgi:alpha-ketoglutarate-dependent 2,4-dichlorophenoxyacetate dioxygenase
MPTFEKLHPRFAARVTDVDLRDNLDDETFKALRQGFAQYSVLVFPDQAMNDEQHIAFSRRLGPLEMTKVGSYGAGTPLVILSNVGEDGKVVPEAHKLNLVHRANSLWHSDSSFKPVAALASMLSAKIVPPEGGETEFAGMIAAWEYLPKKMKVKIEDRIAVHHFATSRNNTDKRLMTKAEYNELPPVEHPLVRDIPETGKRALYVGSHAGAIIGMSQEEAKPLIAKLLEFATRPENVYTHKWSEKDAVLWDNRAVIHRGRPFARDKHARVMIRTTIAGKGSKDIFKAV